MLEACTLEELRGVKQWREAEGAGELALFVGEVLLQVEGTGLESVAELEAILGTADLAGLAAFASGASAP